MKKEFKEINKNITKESKIMYCYVDVTNFPPFLCSQAFEGWMYSDNWNDIFNYLFNNVISILLINTLELCIGAELYDGKYHELNEQIKIYKEQTELTVEKEKALSKLENYNKNLLVEKLDTAKVLEILQDIEKSINVLDLEIDFEIYDNPLLACNSRSIANKEFNYENLESNFIL